MKPFLFLFFLLSSLLSKATNFYVNPSSDSAKEFGSITNPWKSLAAVNSYMKFFKGGDSIFIKRGELYYEKLQITCSGKENAPVIFMAYGTAIAKPVFLYNTSKGSPGYEAIHLFKSKYVIIDGFDITDDNMDPGNHARTANILIGINIDESDFITIKNLNISLVGIGTNINGNNNRVDKCKFKNLRMIRNTVGGYDDYGANAVVISGTGNIISNCFFKDCWANSYDYDYSGGAIKLLVSATENNNNKILNNTAVNCQGFMEIGCLGDASCTNNLIFRNTIINCGELVYIGSNGKNKMNVSHLQILDNYIINTISRLTKPKSMIRMQSTLATGEIINLQHNIFWLLSGIDLTKASQFTNNQIIHRNNIYYLAAGNLNYPEDASESIINRDSPLSKKMLLLHPGFADMDLFPFIYLIKILNTINF